MRAVPTSHGGLRRHAWIRPAAAGRPPQWLDEFLGRGIGEPEPPETAAARIPLAEDRRSAAAARARDAFERAILDSLDAEIAVLDHAGVIIEVNEAWRRFALANQWPPAALAPLIWVGVNYLAVCDAGAVGDREDAGDARLAADGIRSVLEHRLPEFSMEYPCHSPPQHRWFSMGVRPLGDGVVVTHRNITEHKRSEEKLRLAASVFTHAREGIVITAADNTIVDVNEMFTRITGYRRDEAIGKDFIFLASDHHGPEFFRAILNDVGEKGHWYGEVWNRRKDGQSFPTMQTISSVHDACGRLQHYVSLFSDITSLKAYQTQLQHVAHYDVLTSLPNRVLFADRLHQAMTQALRYKHLLAVAYLDLDGFKSINDRYGHEVGDKLLTTLASRMKNGLREGDTLARLGGDEFVIVLVDLADEQTSVPMLDRLVAAVAQPTPLDDLLLQVSASVGVTFYPQTDDADADLLLRQADQAMYQAKLAGRNRYHVFDAELDRCVRGHHESLERISRALIAGEFVLYYQPKVNLRTGRIVGAEALIRWRHPERGLLDPQVFLPVIENHPLAVEVGEWVITAALSQVSRWRRRGLAIPVSVNIGARQLQQADFVERLHRLLAAHPEIRPGDLELEVIETSALQDLARASDVIEACRKMGISFSLDDFGTGYSSLTYLKGLPVKQLKIDQSFVRGMLDDPDDLAILEGVLSLALAFRRQVTAEGVETSRHGEMLLHLGCEIVQGFGIAQPMPEDEFARWAATWRPDPLWREIPAINHADMPLLFASAEYRAWMALIASYLRGERESIPPDNQHYRFGIWLDTERSSHHGEQPVLQTVVSLRRQLHFLAAKLVRLRVAGHAQEALDQLPDLLQLRDILLEQLKALMLSNRT